jgi:hypothetical protein
VYKNVSSGAKVFQALWEMFIKPSILTFKIVSWQIYWSGTDGYANNAE